MRRKYGDEMLVEVVQKRMFGHLLHMTDAAHLRTLESHGLVSARRAQELGIAPRYPGGNDLTRSLDASRGLDNAVFLSFFNLGLMPKHEDNRRRQPVLLKIDARILFQPGVHVALGRANSANTTIYKPARAFYNMDWEVIFGDVDSSNIFEKARVARVYDYEVLVPDQVPVEYILGTT